VVLEAIVFPADFIRSGGTDPNSLCGTKSGELRTLAVDGAHVKRACRMKNS
jgi:hypothetical protein